MGGVVLCQLAPGRQALPFLRGIDAAGTIGIPRVAGGKGQKGWRAAERTCPFPEPGARKCAVAVVESLCPERRAASRPRPAWVKNKAEVTKIRASTMVNYIPKYKSLVVQAEREPHDLGVELRRYSCARVSIHGTPDNLDALSDYPEIEECRCTAATFQI